VTSRLAAIKGISVRLWSASRPARASLFYRCRQHNTSQIVRCHLFLTVAMFRCFHEQTCAQAITLAVLNVLFLIFTRFLINNTTVTSYFYPRKF
jgi:hypothetical protein